MATIAPAAQPVEQDAALAAMPEGPLKEAYKALLVSLGKTTTTAKKPDLVGVPSDYAVYGDNAIKHPDFFLPQFPKYQTSSMYTILQGMSPEDTQQLQQQLVRSGLIGPKQKFTYGDWTDPATLNAWEKLLTRSNLKAQDYQTTLQDLVARPVTGDGTDGGSFTGTKTQVNQSVTKTTPFTAESVVNSLLQKNLGRKASKSEYEQFLSSLNAAEAANPSVSTTSASYVAGEGTGSSTTTTGGLDTGAFNDQYINSDPALQKEKNSFQAGSTYFDAALQMMGGR